jgi:hypothetical protein
MDECTINLVGNIEKFGVSSFIDRASLVCIRRKAMRAGVWFRALRRIDRVLVDLTIQVADGVRSQRLARSILEVTRKLEGALESRFSRAIREIGFAIVQRLSLFAQRWGYGAAVAWASDKGFARYWAVMKLNGHPCSV